MKSLLWVVLAVLSPLAICAEPTEVQTLAKNLRSPNMETRRQAIEQVSNIGAKAIREETGGLKPAGEALLDVILEEDNEDIAIKARSVAEVILDVKSSDLDAVLANRTRVNEVYAKAACNKIFCAQISYWNTDAIQEFAQSLNGDTGLYSDSQTRKRPNFIPKALAQAEGDPKQGVGYRGYRFKLLKEQGDHATGGAKSYMADARLVYGYAIIAYPCQYRRSGSNTYMIDHTGKIRFKDLGAETEGIVKAMTKYNPDFTWEIYIEPKDRPKASDKRDDIDPPVKIED
jgi:hypothetical protein